MKLLKKAGFPLLLLSIAGFNIAPRFQGEAVFNLSLIVMVLGGILLVASPFMRGGGDGEPAPADPALAVPARRPAAVFTGQPSGEPLPLPSGVDVPEFVPAWAILTGGLTSAAGAAAFFMGPNGVNTYSVASFSLMPGGVLFILGAFFFYGSPATRRNIVRGALALLSFLLIVGAIFLGVLIAAEAFAPESNAKFGLLAVVLLVFGMVGAYLGVRYQQSAEGRTIGRELGFLDASGGGPDGIYDSKGVMNGLEVLFNVEQGSPGKRSPAVFRLEVLCRCPNVSGVRLSARPEGLIVISLGSLSRVPDVPRWDFYDVRCEPPEAALRLLPEARRGVNVFSDEAGFESMSLEGSDFKFVFSLQGYIGTAYTRRVLQETSLLASRFV